MAGISAASSTQQPSVLCVCHLYTAYESQKLFGESNCSVAMSLLLRAASLTVATSLVGATTSRKF